MTRFTLAIAFTSLCLATTIQAGTTWKDAALVDTMCASKVMDNPDAHTKKCALQCQKKGYGIFADGMLLKFDEAGNEKALAALKATDRTDHLRVTVSGDLDGDTIKVASLEMN
jgi:hypothetical protein